MSITSAIKNIRKKGIRRYLEDRRNNKAKKDRRSLLDPELKRLLDLSAELTHYRRRISEDDFNACFRIADFISKEGDILKRDELVKLSVPLARCISNNQELLKSNYSDWLDVMLKVLWDNDSKKGFKGNIKKYYVKELYPEIYREGSSGQIENKVIMMEAGKSPSPSSAHLAKVITDTGLYDIVYIGLGIRSVPMSVFYENGIELIEELAGAKAMFLSTANDLISYIDVRPETKVIQLWHGVGAFKHVGRSTVGNENFGKSQKQWDEYDSYRNYHAVTIAGEGQRWIFKEAMHLDDSQILPIGVSRTDVFFDENYKKETREKLYNAYPQLKGKKIILYAPTFRGAVAEAKAPDKLDIRKMAETFSEEYVLLIKHHGLSHDIPPIPEDIEGKFAFDMNSNKVLDIDELLMIADICITDYSSVAFEFAIMERPIIFFTYDLEEYIKERGLYFDFEKDAPGPLCRDTESIIDYINNLDKSFDRDKLLAFKKQYVSACDGHATERTIELIEE